MVNTGIKLATYDYLRDYCFLPRHNQFYPDEFETADGLNNVYSIPIHLWKKHRMSCYSWWGGVFKNTNNYGFKTEVKLVTEKFYCGFRFHLPDSSYIKNYNGDPRFEFNRLRKIALSTNQRIIEIRERLQILNSVLDGRLFPAPEYYQHIREILRYNSECIESLYFGHSPTQPFPTDKYLYYLGRSLGLDPWDLADAGLLSQAAAEHYASTEQELASAEDYDRAISTGRFREIDMNNN